MILMPEPLHHNPSFWRGELQCVSFRVLRYASLHSNDSSAIGYEPVCRTFVTAANAGFLSIVPLLPAGTPQEFMVQWSYDVGCPYALSPPCPNRGFHSRKMVTSRESTRR
jgi:hypothetical protein